MSIGMELRPCRAEDFDGVAALLGQLWPGTALDAAALRPLHDLARASDRQLWLCAVEGARVAGFGTVEIRTTLRDGARVGHVDAMVVDRERRGRGLGARILDGLTAWARERGCRRLDLDSAFHRREAHAFYEAHGFEKRSYHYQKTL